MSRNGSGKNGVTASPKFIEIDDAWLRKIQVWRHPLTVRGVNQEKHKDGFQRRLDERKVIGVMKSVSEGRNVPPIMITMIKGVPVCTDGQHRLEARRRKVYPLYAQINYGDIKDAAADFVDQAKASKVSLYHILSVSPGKFEAKCRSIASRHSANVTQVYNTLLGVTCYRARKREASVSDFSTADRLLGIWANDRRWDSAFRKGLKARASVYAKPGTLAMLGNLMRDQDLRTTRVKVAILKKMKFDKASAFGKKYGTHGDNQRDMRNYALNFLNRKGH